MKALRLYKGSDSWAPFLHRILDINISKKYTLEILNLRVRIFQKCLYVILNA
jgi:hypothetical protein